MTEPVARGAVASVLVFFWLCFSAGWTAVAGTLDELAPGGTAIVKEVVSGDTVTLEDGRSVRLTGIQAPKMAPPRGHGRKAPLADEARTALERLALGRTVTLLFGTNRVDRHDKLLAQLVRDDGLWLQGELVSLGWARVYVLPGQRSVVLDLLARESVAREAKRGIWANRHYVVRTPETLGHDHDTIQVVEGRVLTATVTRGQLYLNFGPDWHVDFTVRVPHRAMKAFRLAHGDPLALQGRLIRVRGWVYQHNGPEIEVIAPEQVEPLEPPPPLPLPLPPQNRQ